MDYTKPQVIAQNTSKGSYAAGCPEKKAGFGGPANCSTQCEIRK